MQTVDEMIAAKKNSSESKTDVLKIEEHSEKRVLFYGGLGSIITWHQHGYFVNSKDPNQPKVDENIIFNCFRNGDRNRPTSDCPGCMVEIDGKPDRPARNYVAPVLVDGDPEPKVFYFKAQIFDALYKGYMAYDADVQDEEIKRSWFRIVNGGNPDWYKQSGITMSKYNGDVPEVLDVRPFVKTFEIAEIAERLHKQAILDDDTLEHFRKMTVSA